MGINKATAGLMVNARLDKTFGLCTIPDVNQIELDPWAEVMGKSLERN
jgi:hypothetical protein